MAPTISHIACGVTESKFLWNFVRRVKIYIIFQSKAFITDLHSLYHHALEAEDVYGLDADGAALLVRDGEGGLPQAV